MYEHLQDDNPRIRLLRRMWEKSRTYEYFLLSCLGLIAVLLGMFLIAQAETHSVDFAVGITLICVSTFSVILASWLVLCRTEERLQRSLDTGQQGGTDSDSVGQYSLESATTPL